MWDIHYDLERILPPEKEGYEFIATYKLFIPYKEIGLQILVRKEQPLPFFYEIIMKLIDIKCNKIENISQLTGVEEDILDDVVGEMSRLDLIYVISNILILTPKGKIALDKLKKTVIEKEELNRIYINSITGKIEDIQQTYNKPSKNNPCLYELIKIDDNFVSERFNDFNQYYQKRQEDFEVGGSNLTIKNEIYQVIGKKYDKLCYSQGIVYIFKNLKDKDLLYEFNKDTENCIYATTFAKQIIDCTGTRKFLKSPYQVEKYLNNKQFTKEESKVQNTNNLIQVIKNKNKIGMNYSEELNKSYFNDRYLFENEYMDILLSVKSIRPTEIIISSGDLNKILDDNVLALIQSCLDNTNVIIICDTAEWKINELKNKVVNYKTKKGRSIKWIDSKNIGQTNIILDPYCAILISYIPISVGSDFLIREISEITFQTAIIENVRNYLLNKNNI